MKLVGIARESGPAYRSVNVIDASVVLKWVLPEHGDAGARSLLHDALLGQRSLIAPSLVWYEVFNALRYKSDLTADDIRERVGYLAKTPVATVAFTAATFRDVIELARARQLTVYDATYVALALDQKAPLVTVDAKLRTACSDLRLVIGLDELYLH